MTRQPTVSSRMKVVMRRPWLYLVGVLAILAILATPVTRITFGGADTRVLPTTAQSRTVDDVRMES